MRPLIPVSAVIDSPRTFSVRGYYKESKPYSARWCDNGSKYYAQRERRVREIAWFQDNKGGLSAALVVFISNLILLRP